MKDLLFTGSACALVTPFKEPTGDVDLSKLEELVNFHIVHHTDALVVCGTTGEASTMSRRERAEAVGVAVKAADGKLPVIAGTGSNATEQAVRLSNDAEKEGVNGLLIVTPYYNKTSQEGLVKHYTFIAERVSTPILVYNVPSRTGLDIKPETYRELAKIRNIVGIKEANGNISVAAQTLAYCREQIAVYSGNDDQTIPFMALGASGVISVAANILPAEMHRLAWLCLANKYREAASLNEKLLPLMQALFLDVNPVPVKEAMALFGLDVGTVRLPLVSTSASVRMKLKTIINNIS